MNIKITVQPETSLISSVADPVAEITTDVTPEIEMRPALGAAVNLIVVTVQAES
jgi:hypothetical protein